MVRGDTGLSSMPAMAPPLAARRLIPWAIEPAMAARLARYARPARHGALLAGVLFAGLIAAGMLPFPVDTHAYWAADPSDPYRPAGPQDFDGYFYSPVFVQVIAPFQALPWTFFAGGWVLLLVGTLAVMTGRYLGLVILLPPVFIELAMGNIHILLGAAIVLGMRWPAAWSFVLLTKVTPAVGLIWFAVRREWSHLVMALGATALLAGVSYVYAPDLWREWLSILAARPSTDGSDLGLYAIVPLAIRVPIAGVVVAWAAATDRAWMVPVAATLALPVLWPNAFAMAVAAIPLARGDRRPRRGLAPVAAT